MATKAKAAPAKSGTRKTAKKAETIYWVLSERTKLFMWKPIELYTSYDAAAAARTRREEASTYSLNGYKVDRVELV